MIQTNLFDSVSLSSNVFLFNVLGLQESSHVPRKCDQYVFKESLMAQSAAGTKTDNIG